MVSIDQTDLYILLGSIVAVSVTIGLALGGMFKLNDPKCYIHNKRLSDHPTGQCRENDEG